MASLRAIRPLARGSKKGSVKFSQRSHSRLGRKRKERERWLKPVVNSEIRAEGKQRIDAAFCFVLKEIFLCILKEKFLFRKMNLVTVLVVGCTAHLRSLI